MGEHSRPRPLPYRRVLEALVDDLFPGAVVVRTRRLRGGLGTLMHVVEVDRDGERSPLTLRRHNQPQWGGEEEMARKEWEVMTLLRSTPIPAPEPIWLDANGERFGVPAMLLGHLEGRPILDPDDIGAWAEGLASTLASIHAVPTEPFAGALPDETREDRLLRYLAEEVGVEETSSTVVNAPDVIGIVRERIPQTETRRCLTHGDYHPGNVLWSEGTISGVLDWPGARIGDPRLDLAYLRLDTALILGEQAADAILRAYERATGASVDDLAAWDLLAVTAGLPEPIRWLDGYLELGRIDLDADTIRQRYREFTARALQRL